MPRHIRLLLCLAVVLSVQVRAPKASAAPAGWQLLESSAQRLHLRIEVPPASVKTVEVEGRSYSALSIPGYWPLAEPGLPLLPQRGAWIALPPRGEARVRVEGLTTRPLQITRLLPYATPVTPPPGQSFESLSGLESGNEKIVEGPGYASFRSGSDELVSLGEAVWSHGQRMAPLRVRPFLVDSADGPVQQLSSLELVIEFPAGSVSSPAAGSPDPATLARVLNPKVAAGWHAESPQTRLRRSAALQPAPQLQKSVTAALAADQIIPMDQLTLLSDEYRIPVVAGGLVRVHLADLFGTLGFPAGIRHDQLRLYQKRPAPPGSASYPNPLSVDVPFHYFGNPDPQSEITSGDIIIFDATPLDRDNLERPVGAGTLPAAMSERAGNYNANNVYWLAAIEPSLGAWARMDTESFSAASGTPRQYYDYQESFSQDVYYQPHPVKVADTCYLWNSPLVRETRLPLRLRALDPTSPIVVRWVFASSLHAPVADPVGQQLATSFYLENEDTSNRTLLRTVDVNDATGASRPGTYSSPTAVSDTVSAGILAPGPIRFRFHNVNESSSLFHFVMVDSVSLSYRAAYAADFNRAAFNTGVVSQEASLSIPGFDSPEIFLLETSDPRSPRWVDLKPENLVDAGGTTSISLQVPPEGQSPRSFVAVASVEIPRINQAEITRGSTTVLTANMNPAQVLVIGPPQFEAAMQPWLQWRRDHDHDGWNYAYVDVQDIFDQFSGGLRAPSGIKEFLHYAYTMWNAKAVMLVGDANEDHRRIVRENNQIAGTEDFVPCPIHLQYLNDFEVVASDKWYVIFDIDDSRYPALLNKGPDMLFGRLPVHDAAEASSAVAKIIAYEQPTAAQTWRKRAIMVSDDAYSTGLFLGTGGDQVYKLYSSELLFQSVQAQLADQESNFLDGAIDGTTWALDDYTSQIRGTDTSYPLSFLNVVIQEVAATVRPQFLATLAQGAFFVSYQGHSAYNVLAHERLFQHQPGDPSPIGTIGNDGKPFLFFGMGCHFSDFIRPTELSTSDSRSLGESMLLHPTAGAIGVYGSSAYEFLSPNVAFGTVMGNAFFGATRSGQVLGANDPQWIVGDVLAQAEWDLFSAPTAQIPQMVAQYELLGDPLVRLDAAPPRVSVKSDGTNVSDGSPVLPASGSRTLSLSVTAVDESGVDRIELTQLSDGQSTDLSDLLVPQSGAGLDARNWLSIADLPIQARGRDGGVSYQLQVYDRAYPQRRPTSFSFKVPFELTVDVDGEVLPSEGREIPAGSTSVLSLDFTSPISLTATEIEVELTGLTLQGSIDKQMQDTEGRHWIVSFEASGLAGSQQQSILLKLAGSDTEISLAGSIAKVALAIKDHFPIPNPVDPAQGGARIVADLTVPAAWARVTIYDLSGRPVTSWTDDTLGSETTIVLHWDGRDRRGDELANGTYLYRIEVAGQDGEVHGGDTGRIVVMH
ncbi:MAG TPA: C25 family cysteine peptidase [Candidatus Krumholzibacteria bacterium]|nr:C25 family cysteine peptidase [Candidatus Krumholzibacteria bacterium]